MAIRLHGSARTTPRIRSDLCWTIWQPRDSCQVESPVFRTTDVHPARHLLLIPKLATGGKTNRKELMGQSFTTPHFTDHWA